MLHAISVLANSIRESAEADVSGVKIAYDVGVDFVFGAGTAAAAGLVGSALGTPVLGVIASAATGFIIWAIDEMFEIEENVKSLVK